MEGENSYSWEEVLSIMNAYTALLSLHRKIVKDVDIIPRLTSRDVKNPREYLSRYMEIIPENIAPYLEERPRDLEREILEALENQD